MTVDEVGRLTALAERCEQATGPDRELDYAVSEAIGLGCVRSTRPLREDYAEETGGLVIPRYSASLDAAMTLVPDEFHITHSGEGRFLTRGRFCVTLETWDDEQADDGSNIHTTPIRRHGVAQTFALALAASALRARSATTQGRDGEDMFDRTAPLAQDDAHD